MVMIVIIIIIIIIIVVIIIIIHMTITIILMINVMIMLVSASLRLCPPPEVSLLLPRDLVILEGGGRASPKVGAGAPQKRSPWKVSKEMCCREAGRALGSSPVLAAKSMYSKNPQNPMSMVFVLNC